VKAANSRPNVIVIIADQFRHDMFSLANGPFKVRTPNIDKLAQRGVRFTNAYSANPTCMPNRASIATGRWPSVHGTRTNGISFDQNAETFMRTLRRAGYKNYAIGKLHHQVMGWAWEDYQLEEMRLRNPEVLADMRDAISRGQGDWQNWENAQRHRESFVQMPADYYGYDHVDLVVGHGDNPSGHFHHWANQKGAHLKELAGWQNSAERSESVEDVFVSEVPEHLHPNAFITEKFRERLIQAKTEGDPYLFFISFPDPHHPFAPPKNWFDKWRNTDISVPESFFTHSKNAPAHIEAMYAATGKQNIDSTMTWAPTEQQMHDVLRAQLAQIEFMDNALGDLVAALEEQGELENTYIVFSGDHGDLMGEHGLMLKHFVHFDAVTRVPLIIAGPGLEPQIDDRMVSSTDIAPTVIAMASAEPYRGIQGKDLLGEHSNWRDALVIEEDQPFGIEGLPGPIKMRTLVTQDYRFTVYGGTDQAELYDRTHGNDDSANVINTSTTERNDAYKRLAHELINLTEEGIAPLAGA
jgi:arylsulfatase A-like enzyme